VHPHVVEAALAAPRLDITQWWNLHQLLPIGVVGIISWSVWLTRSRDQIGGEAQSAASLL
jgi:hypothetical protein